MNQLGHTCLYGSSVGDPHDSCLLCQFARQEQERLIREDNREDNRCSGLSTCWCPKCREPRLVWASRRAPWRLFKPWTLWVVRV